MRSIILTGQRGEECGPETTKTVLYCREEERRAGQTGGEQRGELGREEMDTPLVAWLVQHALCTDHKLTRLYPSLD